MLYPVELLKILKHIIAKSIAHWKRKREGKRMKVPSSSIGMYFHLICQIVKEKSISFRKSR